jgi:hypothetical protein
MADFPVPSHSLTDSSTDFSIDIVLCTLNAKYIHASLGLRYLLANMGDLQPKRRCASSLSTAKRKN